MEREIKAIQKFINQCFRHEAWLKFEDTQMDYMLKPFFIEKTPKNEYNALWDTLLWLSDHYSFMDGKNLAATSSLSVTSLYNYNLTVRKDLQ